VGQLRGNKSVRITRVCQEPAEPKAVGPERIGGGSGGGDRR